MRAFIETLIFCIVCVSVQAQDPRENRDGPGHWHVLANIYLEDGQHIYAAGIDDNPTDYPKDFYKLYIRFLLYAEDFTQPDRSFNAWVLIGPWSGQEYVWIPSWGYMILTPAEYAMRESLRRVEGRWEQRWQNVKISTKLDGEIEILITEKW